MKWGIMVALLAFSGGCASDLARAQKACGADQDCQERFLQQIAFNRAQGQARLDALSVGLAAAPSRVYAPAPAPLLAPTVTNCRAVIGGWQCTSW